LNISGGKRPIMGIIVNNAGYTIKGITIGVLYPNIMIVLLPSVKKEDG